MLQGRCMQPQRPVWPRAAPAAPLLQRPRAPQRIPALSVLGSAGGQGQSEATGAAHSKGFGEAKAAAKPADVPRAKARGFGKPKGVAKAAEETFEELEEYALNQMLMVKFSGVLEDEDITFQGPTRGTFAWAVADTVVAQLTASTVEMEETRGALQRIFKLIDKTKLQATHMYFGGSCGRGTLVAGCHDVDLIVCVRGIKNRRLAYEDWHKDPSVGREIRQMAKEALLRKAKAWDIRISPHEQYRYAMRVTVGRVKIDLLLLPDVVPEEIRPDVTAVPGKRLNRIDPRVNMMIRAQHDVLMGPVYADPKASRYSILRERANSAALTEVVRSQPQEMRAVARAVKAWRNSLEVGLVPECGIGSSTLEILTLAAHQRLVAQGHEPKGNVYVVELLIASLRLLAAAVEGREVVTVDAGEWGPGCRREELVERYGHCWEDDPVRIIHPIDPTCNMARLSKGERCAVRGSPRNRADKPEPKWGPVAAEARYLAQLLETGTLVQVLRALLPAVEISHEGVLAAQRQAMGLPPSAPGDRPRLSPLRVLRALISTLTTRGQRAAPE
ncbi:hypothetical protein HYH03_011900 [Edaphochlamys debaryana]|uniref:Uncharacterized protein n=1 Tax=Edaphochlamys debaryana TaxID=47281 RepID=A0A835XZ88_9CHLO|nr:hypothetical protein HYH03_011900 [Edaphochlamys debaryana]|eukprot:KAG2489620.1 hypothetical protein HYH03_011900 [Edaphochlamys debaryana]